MWLERAARNQGIFEMVIETYEGLLTKTSWWSNIRLRGKIIQLETGEGEKDHFLVLGYYSTQKEAKRLYEGINEARQFELNFFSVPRWEARNKV